MTAPEVRTPDGNRANADQATRDDSDSATSIAALLRPAKPHEADTAKTIATLRARFALAGWCLHSVNDHDGESYHAVRWGHVRALPDLAAVEEFAQRVGVKA
jgi:hypothetical protein